MKRRIVLALAVPLLIGLPCAGLCGETPSGPSIEEDPAVSDKTGEPCRAIAAALRAYPALKIRMSEGTVPDAGNEPGSPGCRVHSSGSTASITGEVSPDEAVKHLLERRGWEEDPDYSADGAGTTSFALRKGGILCLVNAGAPSGFEDGEYFVDEFYELDARCAVE